MKVEKNESKIMLATLRSSAYLTRQWMNNRIQIWKLRRFTNKFHSETTKKKNELTLGRIDLNTFYFKKRKLWSFFFFTKKWGKPVEMFECDNAEIGLRICESCEWWRMSTGNDSTWSECWLENLSLNMKTWLRTSFPQQKRKSNCFLTFTIIGNGADIPQASTSRSCR